MSSKKEDDAEEEKSTLMEKEVQVFAKEKLEEVYLSDDPQKLRPISINSKLTKEEKTSLVELLREYGD